MTKFTDFVVEDLKELRSHISKNTNKGLRNVLFLFGLVAGAVSPKLEFDFEFMGAGIFIGFMASLLWLAVQYKQIGEESLIKTRGAVSVAVAYIVYFSAGVIVGYYLVKPVLNFVY